MKSQYYRTRRPSVNDWMCKHPELTVICILSALGFIGAIMDYLS